MIPLERKAVPAHSAPLIKAQPLIYRINAATERLGVSRNTIYRLVNAGDLELVKVGVRASGITTKSLNAFLEKGRTEESKE